MKEHMLIIDNHCYFFDLNTEIVDWLINLGLNKKNIIVVWMPYHTVSFNGLAEEFIQQVENIKNFVKGMTELFEDVCNEEKEKQNI